ncbi:AraC family transcriptional regulator [Anaeroselena agilis]|uniref:AraC family transcriptional regulator n=1 Tax=Anaeroselena agilis TaxID=3063788 RepID=A0ABU3P443_9FIRM|nr:AraC family transcriptional regulator [Selenomonadales bacterium 4137-cl]
MACERATISLNRVRELHNVELVRARGVEHSLPRHMHDKLCVSIIDSGAREFFYRGGRYVVAPGQVQVVPPGEAHTCRTAAAMYSYRVVCIDETVLADTGGRSSRLPAATALFRSPVVEDAVLYRSLANMHDILSGQPGALEKGEAFHATVAQLFRHAATAPDERPAGSENGAVRQIKDYLEGQFERNVSLDELVLITGLSPYHLVRVFTAAVGMPPHAYLNQVRVTRAKLMLAAGRRLADAALAAGYADQSHFQRSFKKVMGITPGQYLAAL